MIASRCATRGHYHYSVRLSEEQHRWLETMVRIQPGITLCPSWITRLNSSNELVERSRELRRFLLGVGDVTRDTLVGSGGNAFLWLLLLAQLVETISFLFFLGQISISKQFLKDR